VYLQKNKKSLPKVHLNVFAVQRNEQSEIIAYNVPPHPFPKETDENGKFTLTLSSDEEYMVSFVKEDYLPEPEVLLFGKKKISEGEHISIEVPMMEYEGLLVHGHVTDNYRKPLENVEVSLQEVETSLTQKVLTDKLGAYLFRLSAETTYVLRGDKKGFFLYTTDDFTTEGKDVHTFVKDFKMEKIEIGHKHTLEKFIFSVNQEFMNENGKAFLEPIIKMLQENPDLKIEIACHSDSRGDDEYNLVLSQKRAEHIRDYLVNQGIELSRLEAKGYGETQLLNECKNGVRCPTTKHEENRRIIIEVLGWE
jgi:outer membrane protein OmpA-like peptidoglycan-associated protein